MLPLVISTDGRDELIGVGLSNFFFIRQLFKQYIDFLWFYLDSKSVSIASVTLIRNASSGNVQGFKVQADEAHI